jgi:hypothetical protein
MTSFDSTGNALLQRCVANPHGACSGVVPNPAISEADGKNIGALVKLCAAQELAAMHKKD